MITQMRNELTAQYSGLLFDEGPHTYHVDDKPMSSVSSVISNFYEKFDEEKWSAHTAQKKGMTQDAVKAMWKEINEKSLKLGNEVHDFAERYAEQKYYGGPIAHYRPNELQKSGVVQFYTDLPSNYMPVGLELQMFDKELGIAGTTDILFYNSITGKFVIADWKTNINIFKNFANKTMLPPFEYTLDMPYNHYQIQLSLYQILLESRGYEIEERWIVWLPHSGGYERHKTFDFTAIIKKQLATC